MQFTMLKVHQTKGVILVSYMHANWDVYLTKLTPVVWFKWLSGGALVMGFFNTNI